MKLDADILKKESQLIDLIKSLQSVLVAFSGGVDSTYLLAVSLETLGANCKGVFARGPMISAQEQKETLSLAQTYQFPLEVIDINVLELQEFRANSPERCYFCKKEIFSRFLALGEGLGYTTLIEGTNASDSQDYRPGRKALQELKVKSPLLEVGLTKEEIRLLSQRRNLRTWNKPSMACLASRVPYGDLITLELLSKVAQAEAILQSKGFGECRVRVHGDIARIEIPIENFAPFLQNHSEFANSFKGLGFRFVTLDLDGLRSGSLNPEPEGGKLQ
ncbi:ATP-dependent sacrificial sulfur transferase LarE [Desulfosporosinus sp. PR]|uniref:ATP-dependent sacrificial sulfur transferase LarE n=1 Tax=Candidatus Desulfosporosinus nitrosoreducens TaxID=3401928 RepID=UPI0027E6C1B9|nr:ATP-dependent sacrificial sulfur transferase LarE [Desulfosporosinus sp. PR]MDQ7094905.1 ATP-dependent sacrificial sulfur transferase LarE [Desulfosporosinus sp. PR]